MRLKSFNEAFDFQLRDREIAAGVLDLSFQDDGMKGFLDALRDVVRANGGVAAIAEATGLNREGLYDSLSREGNPRLSTLAAVLKAVGLRISIVPAGPEAEAASAESAPDRTMVAASA